MILQFIALQSLKDFWSTFWSEQDFYVMKYIPCYWLGKAQLAVVRAFQLLNDNKSFVSRISVHYCNTGHIAYGVNRSGRQIL